MVVASFLRLVTNPKIFIQPTPVDDAIRFVDALVGVAGVEMPSLGAEWAIFRGLCLEKKFAANDIPDAWLAAASHSPRRTLAFDADFKKLLKRTQLTVLSPG